MNILEKENSLLSQQWNLCDCQKHRIDITSKAIIINIKKNPQDTHYPFKCKTSKVVKKFNYNSHAVALRSFERLDFPCQIGKHTFSSSESATGHKSYLNTFKF